MPFLPCCANLYFDGAMGSRFCPLVIVVMRWPCELNPANPCRTIPPASVCNQTNPSATARRPCAGKSRASPWAEIADRWHATFFARLRRHPVSFHRQQHSRCERGQRRRAEQTGAALEKLAARFVAHIILDQRMRCEFGNHKIIFSANVLPASCRQSGCNPRFLLPARCRQHVGDIHVSSFVQIFVEVQQFIRDHRVGRQRRHVQFCVRLGIAHRQKFFRFLRRFFIMRLQIGEAGINDLLFAFVSGRAITVAP